MISRRAVLGAGSVVIMTVAAGCLGTDHQFRTLETDPDTWRIPRFDLQNTACNPRASVPDDPTELWRWEPESKSDGIKSLVVSEELVIGAEGWTGAERVVALDRETGSVQWTTDGHGAEALAIGSDSVLVSQRNGLVAFDPNSGSEQWSVDDESIGVQNSLLLDGETVYRTGWRGIQAFEIETADLLWEITADVNGRQYWSIADDRLFVGGNGVVRSYELADSLVRFWEDDIGKERWQQLALGHALNPVVWDDRVITGGLGMSHTHNEDPLQEDGLTAFDVVDGSVDWHVSMPSWTVSVPVIVGNRAISHAIPERVGGSAKLFAVTESGDVDWETNVEPMEPTMTIAAGDTVVSAGSGEEDYLIAASATDGTLIWEREVSVAPSRRTGVDRGLVVVDGQIVVGTRTGGVAAYG